MPAATPMTSASLLERVQAHDRVAWTQLARLYGPLVYRWVRKWGIAPRHSAEVVENVFRRLLRGMFRYPEEVPQESFREWLWVQTRATTRDFMRYRRASSGGDSEPVRRYVDVAEILPDPDDFDERRGLIHRAIELLRQEVDERDWHVFSWAINNLSDEEIALRLNWSPGDVQQARLRFLYKLEQLISDF